MNWPTKEDYNRSMQNLNILAIDEDLHEGRVEMDEIGANPANYGGAKLYNVTYRIELPRPLSWFPSANSLIVRCFCKTPEREPPGDILKRYDLISAFCLDKYKDYPSLLPVKYVKRAIKVYYTNEDTGDITGNEIFPIVKMPFLKVPSLGVFVARNYRSKETMIELCSAWLNMIRDLEIIGMAHGDLDLTNVLVEEDRSNGKPLLRLIDYDNVWIEDLKDREQTEGGHDAFQRPYYKRPYNAEMDRFSALAIYISLRALSFYPELYDRFKANEKDYLLFRRQDYEEIRLGNSGSNRIVQLHKLGIEELKPHLAQLISALCHEDYVPCSLDAVPLPPIKVLWYLPADDKAAEIASVTTKVDSMPAAYGQHTQQPTPFYTATTETATSSAGSSMAEQQRSSAVPFRVARNAASSTGSSMAEQQRAAQQV